MKDLAERGSNVNLRTSRIARMIVAVSTATASVLSVSMIPAVAAGHLDPTFDADGKVTAPGPVDGWARDVVVAPSGAVSVVGSWGDLTPFGPIHLIAMRFLADGSPDTAFGNGGVAEIPVGDTSTANAAALQPDGKLLIAGLSVTAGVFSWLIVRLNTDGTLDPTFDGDGIVTLAPTSGRNIATGIAVAASGRIFVVGDVRPGTGASLAALTASGGLDPAFSGDGLAAVGLRGANQAVDVGVTPSGKIVVAGGRWVARFLAGGKPDRTLGGTGHVKSQMPGGSTRGLAIQGDGKIVLSGGVHPAGSTTGSDAALVRLRINGSLDPSFGGDGRVSADFAKGEDSAEDVVVAPTGKIIAGGYTIRPSGVSTFIALRYTANGTPDISFGAKGKVSVPFGVQAYGYGIARQSNGKLVLAGRGESPGHHDSCFAIIRLLP